MARYPDRAMDVSSCGPPCRNQRFDVFGISGKSAVRPNKLCEPLVRCRFAAVVFGQGQRRHRAVTAVETHLDARRAAHGGFTKSLAILLTQSGQHALDML